MTRVARVVHIHQTSGPFTYIGRPGRFGNPFPLRGESTRAEVIAQFREYFLARVANDPDFRADVLRLKGQDLACWCAPKPCHGDVILTWLEEQ